MGGKLGSLAACLPDLFNSLAERVGLSSECTSPIRSRSVTCSNSSTRGLASLILAEMSPQRITEMTLEQAFKDPHLNLQFSKKAHESLERLF